MVIAADYPFMDVLWTMIIFFAFLIWIWMMVVILNDVFRRRDVSGWGKAGWTVFLIVLPFLGALTYLIANHEGMVTRAVSSTEVTQAQHDYLRSVTTNGGATAEIEKAKELLDSGAITEIEYEAIKARVIT